MTRINHQAVQELANALAQKMNCGPTGGHPPRPAPCPVPYPAPCPVPPPAYDPAQECPAPSMIPVPTYERHHHHHPVQVVAQMPPAPAPVPAGAPPSRMTVDPAAGVVTHTSGDGQVTSFSLGDRATYDANAKTLTITHPNGTTELVPLGDAAGPDIDGTLELSTDPAAPGFVWTPPEGPALLIPMPVAPRIDRNGDGTTEALPVDANGASIVPWPLIEDAPGSDTYTPAPADANGNPQIPDCCPEVAIYNDPADPSAGYTLLPTATNAAGQTVYIIPPPSDVQVGSDDGNGALDTVYPSVVDPDTGKTTFLIPPPSGDVEFSDNAPPELAGTLLPKDAATGNPEVPWPQIPDPDNPGAYLPASADENGQPLIPDCCPTHEFAACRSAVAEVINAGGTQPVLPLSMNRLGHDYWGGQIGPNSADASLLPNGHIDPNLLPLTVPMPPTSSPDCVMALVVNAMGTDFNVSPTVFDGPPIITPGSNLGAPVYVGKTNDFLYNGEVFLFDVNDTQAGQVAVIDWPPGMYNPAEWNGDPGRWVGFLQYTWVEICRPGGAVAVGDFDLGAVAQVNGPDFPPNAGVTPMDPEVDMGPCDAVMFGAGRHLTPDGHADGEFIVDTENGIISDVLDKAFEWQGVTHAAACYGFSWGGLVPGGSGPQTYSFQPNDNGFIGNRSVGGVLIPLANCEPVVGSGSQTQAACSTTVEAKQEGVVRNSLRVSAKLCVPAGETLTVTPQLNGVSITEQVAEFDNTNGAAEVCVTLPVGFSIVDLANVVNAGDSITSDFGYLVEGTGTVNFSETAVETEVVHL